jgi:hypothetical protein
MAEVARSAGYPRAFERCIADAERLQMARPEDRAVSDVAVTT